jgi:hypothetical protein
MKLKLMLTIAGVFTCWMDSPIGYLPPALWLLIAVGFFLTGHASRTAAAA